MGKVCEITRVDVCLHVVPHIHKSCVERRNIEISSQLVTDLSQHAIDVPHRRNLLGVVKYLVESHNPTQSVFLETHNKCRKIFSDADLLGTLIPGVRDQLLSHYNPKVRSNGRFARKLLNSLPIDRQKQQENHQHDV